MCFSTRSVWFLRFHLIKFTHIKVNERKKCLRRWVNGRSSWLHTRSWIKIKILFSPDGVLKLKCSSTSHTIYPHIRATLSFPANICENCVFQSMSLERKFSGIGAEDKCFIEFNYVEMILMSCVYKQRKALAIKSRKSILFSLSPSPKWIFSDSRFHSVEVLIDFYFDGTKCSSLKLCTLVERCRASHCALFSIN